MLANNIAIVYLVQILLYKIQNLNNELKLFLDPLKIIDQEVLRKHKLIKKVFMITHHVIMCVLLLIQPIDWVLNKVGLLSMVKVTQYRKHRE